MTALGIGVLLVCGLGILHHGGMIAVRRAVPSAKDVSHLAVMGVFCALLVLHVVEILLFAGVYRLLASWPAMGSFGPEFNGTWSSFVYLSGMNFVTLGYANFDADGPVRLIGMMESLGGFMVLTWSATFIYSVSASLWDRSSG